MEIKINIEKKHLFAILFIFVAFGGLIVVIAQTIPNPGHSLNQVPEATRNCLNNPSTFCNSPTIQSWGYGNVAVAAGMAYDSQNLGGVSSSSYCKSNGVNSVCPNPVHINSLPSEIVYKVSATNYCLNSAIYCKSPDSGQGGRIYGNSPIWRNNRWEYDSYDISGNFMGPGICQWVLCDTIDSITP